MDEKEAKRLLRDIAWLKGRVLGLTTVSQVQSAIIGTAIGPDGQATMKEMLVALRDVGADSDNDDETLLESYRETVDKTINLIDTSLDLQAKHQHH